MTDKEIQLLIDLADNEIKKLGEMSPEDAKAYSLDSLCRAGILDRQGNFTEPYKELEQLFQ